MSRPSGAAVAATDDEHDLDDPSTEILNPLSARTLGWVLLVFGTIAFVAAGALSIEDWKVATDPGYVPSCSFSVFITCTAAMESWQGKLLGFPNPFIGIAVFPVVMTTGVALLNRFVPPRWYRAVLLAGTTVGLGLVAFLVWTSLYRLGKLCPYCMVVWISMIPVFWFQLVHALQERVLPAPARLRATIVRNRSVGLVVLYLALVVWVFAVLHDPLIKTLF